MNSVMFFEFKTAFSEAATPSHDPAIASYCAWNLGFAGFKSKKPDTPIFELDVSKETEFEDAGAEDLPSAFKNPLQWFFMSLICSLDSNSFRHQ